MNPSIDAINSINRIIKSIALIAILSAVLIYQASMIADKNHKLSLGSVSSPLLAAAPAPAPARAKPAYMPNYAENAIALRHWTKRELTVHVTTSANDDKTPQEIAEAVAQSAAIWNEKVGDTVTLKVSDAPDPDIDITFVTPGTLPGGAIGLTDVRFSCDDQAIGYASIRVNEKIAKAELVQVLAHEMGHALGIQGHSDDRDDLMYPFAHLPVQITDRDMNTFHMGYALPTGNTSTVTVE